ncbi:Hypothetical protein AT6N2_L1386 [Agrobacterium tumefaciens]|nr:Hypothetical protein AT6N2_L1386 [Agrobacterium tumefaciens]
MVRSRSVMAALMTQRSKLGNRLDLQKWDGTARNVSKPAARTSRGVFDGAFERLQYRALGKIEIDIHLVARLFRLAFLHQRQDFAVHVDKGRMKLFGIFQEAETQPQFRSDTLVKVADPGTVEEIDHGGVKFHVGAAHAQPIGGLALDFGVLDRCAHRLDRRMLVPGLAQGPTLNHAPHPVNVDDRRHGGHGNKDATIGFMTQQPVLRQKAECFAQRVAGDIKTFTEGRL